jgi:hypothetical protein
MTTPALYVGKIWRIKMTSLMVKTNGVTLCQSKEMATQKNCDHFDPTPRTDGSNLCFHFRDWSEYGDKFYVCDYNVVKVEEKK